MDEILVAVQTVAEQQHGVVSADQMIGAGASHRWVARRAADGILVRVGPAVYRFGGVKPAFETRAMAAVLSARGAALISHRSAAYLHGIGQRGTVPGFVDVTVERHRRPRRRAGITVHETSASDLAGATVRDRIPVTGVARTILDCSAVVAEPVKLLDDACRLGIVSWPELWGCYLQHKVRGRRGLSRYRAVLEQRDGNVAPGGDFARIVADLLVAGGLPMPVFEHKVVIGGHVYYLDLAWPDRLVCVECNDDGSHRTGKGFWRDPMKRNRCEGAGWRYLEYTWLHARDEPGELLGQVGEALGRAAA